MRALRSPKWEAKGSLETSWVSVQQMQHGPLLYENLQYLIIRFASTLVVLLNLMVPWTT